MNRKDFRTVVESYCPVKYIKYHQRQDKFYGEYFFEGKNSHC